MQLLHVQTKTFPTYHRRLRVPAEPVPVAVADQEIVLRPGSMRSLAYSSQPLLSADITSLVEGRDLDLPVTWARVQLLSTAVVLVSVASDGAALERMTLLEACDLDADVAARRRNELAPCLTQLFDAILATDLIEDPMPQVGWAPGRGAASLASSTAARYSCHLVSRSIRWEADPRVRSGSNGGHGAVLLPYTYQWDLDPELAPDELLGHLEPADLVVAQRSVLGAAATDALAMLDRLSGAEPTTVPVADLRCHLDRVRVAYHRLDEYRYDSAQRERGLYLSARAELGLDEIHARSETVLGQAAESLEAASSARTLAMDRRLNRLAALFTIVASGAFALQAVEFLTGGPPEHGWQRALVLTIVVALGAAAPLAFALWQRQRRAST